MFWFRPFQRPRSFLWSLWSWEIWTFLRLTSRCLELAPCIYIDSSISMTITCVFHASASVSSKHWESHESMHQNQQCKLDQYDYRSKLHLLVSNSLPIKRKLPGKQASSNFPSSLSISTYSSIFPLSIYKINIDLRNYFDQSFIQNVASFSLNFST